MKKHSYDFIKKQFEIDGYKLLSKEYIGANEKLNVGCNNGHQYKVTYGDFYTGYRCQICYDKTRGDKLRFRYNYVKEQFEKEGYKLLSNKYKNCMFKLKVECPENHIYEITYGHFQQGVRCPICFIEKQKLSYDYIKNQIEKTGYKLLSKEYKNSVTNIEIECPKGHQYEVTYTHFQQGVRCPICWKLKTHSQSEKDCLNVVKQFINENVIENDRTQIINPKTNQFLELDVWIPSLRKAVEFNGEYWHNNEYSKYKDKQKQSQCKEKGIELLIIWYQDWIDKREEQINNLKEFING